jgi:hypothetical protein
MSCVDCGDSLEASLSGAWNGYSWVTRGSQYEFYQIKTGIQLEVTYNMIDVGTTKE